MVYPIAMFNLKCFDRDEKISIACEDEVNNDHNAAHYMIVSQYETRTTIKPSVVKPKHKHDMEF